MYQIAIRDENGRVIAYVEVTSPIQSWVDGWINKTIEDHKKMMEEGLLGYKRGVKDESGI